VVAGSWLIWGIVAVSPAPVQAQGGGNASDAEVQPRLDLRHLWNFDEEKLGQSPPGFAAVTVGEGQAGQWSVEADPKAPTAPNRLVQTQPCPGSGCFQMLFAQGIVYDYVDLSVRLRMASDGSVTKAADGGLLFRVKDARNFYAAIVDLSANTLEVIRVADGQATLLGHESVKPNLAVWHFLRVRHDTILSKDLIEVAFDGKIVFSTWDPARSGGLVGLVTRGDGVVGFDNFYAIRLYSQKPLSSPAPY
jgi:hypothetical protein